MASVIEHHGVTGTERVVDECFQVLDILKKMGGKNCLRDHIFTKTAKIGLDKGKTDNRLYRLAEAKLITWSGQMEDGTEAFTMTAAGRKASES